MKTFHYYYYYYYYYYYSQIYPSTLRLNLASCKPNVENKIQIKSTVPVLRDPITRKYLNVTIYPPNGLKVRDGKCQQQLTENRLSFDVDILPDCKALQENRMEKKNIVITYTGGGKFWMVNGMSVTISVRFVCTNIRSY